jgi:uncharacterized membrane protein YccC
MTLRPPRAFRSGWRARLAGAPGAPAWGRGLRLATAMIAPLAAGVAVGHATAGLLVGVGAFVVASTDTGGPYRPRAVTMIAATLGTTAAYFLGAVTATPHWLSVLLFVIVLTGSALTGTTGPDVALVSTMFTIAFIIGAFLPSSLAADAGAALALLAGGGWAMGLSLAGCSFDPRRPERRAVSAAIGSCAAFIGELDPAGRGTAHSGSGAREAARQSLAAARQALQAARPPDGLRIAGETGRLWAALYATGALFDAIVTAERQRQVADPGERPATSQDIAPAVAALQAAVAGTAAAVRAGRAARQVAPRARLNSLGATASAEVDRLGGRLEPGPADEPTATVMRRLDEAEQALIAVASGPVPDPGWIPAGASGRRWRAVAGVLRQPSPAVLRYAVQQAVAGGLALVVANLFDPAHGAWLVSSTVLVVKPNVGGTLSTARQRAAATVAGALIAGGVVAVTANEATLIALSFIVATVAMAFMPLSYSLGMLVITPLSILLTAVLTGGGWLIAVSRVENILIGVAIAVVVGCLCFPAWLRASAPGLLASAMDRVGRYLDLVRQPPRAAGAPDERVHRARSDAETAVASLRATADQLSLEPGSGRWAAVLGDASVAAARLLDAIIMLRQALDRAGPEQPAGATAAVTGQASDALSCMQAAVCGQAPAAAAPLLVAVRHPRSRADALFTGAAITPDRSGGGSPPGAREPRPVLLSVALEQLADDIAGFRRVLGRLPAASPRRPRPSDPGS